jgi:hypothetical protein
MRNYYRACICAGTSNLDYEEIATASTDRSTFKAEMQKKLLANTANIWQEIQQKVSLFFGAMVFEHFKFDDFLDILIVVNKLVYFFVAAVVSLFQEKRLLKIFILY